MTIFEKLRKWAEERLIDKVPFDKVGHTQNIIEELTEMWSLPKGEQRKVAKELTEVIHSYYKDGEPSEEDIVDALTDQIVFCSTSLVQLGYDVEKVLNEVHKEINSRTGGYSEKEKKWIKDETKKHLWYKADFSKCKYQEDTHTSYASPVAEHPNGLLENDEAYYHPSWNAKKVLKAFQEIDRDSYPNITDIVQIEVDGVLVWGMCK